MFKIIEPHRQCYYQARLDLFMGLMKLQQSVDLSPEEQQQATFILAGGEEGDVYGGALLYRKSLQDLHPQLKRTILTFSPYEKEVWECTIFVEPHCLSHIHDFGAFMKIFYKSLLEKLFEVGRRKGIPYLCLRLNAIESLRIRKRAVWPWMVEVIPQASLDSLFHGIISLREDEGWERVSRNLPIKFPLQKKEVAI